MQCKQLKFFCLPGGRGFQINSIPRHLGPAGEEGHFVCTRDILLDQRYPAGYPAGEEGHMVWTRDTLLDILLERRGIWSGL